MQKEIGSPVDTSTRKTHAAQSVGVPMRHCLLIDDTAANVTAARSLGMTGVHFRRFTDIYEVLLAIG